MFFKQEQRLRPRVGGGNPEKSQWDSKTNMKIALLLVLMSTIVMIAYLAVPAQPAAEAEARQ
jgi:hypothetical protein